MTLEGPDNMNSQKQVVLPSGLRGLKEGKLVLDLDQEGACKAGALGPVWSF